MFWTVLVGLRRLLRPQQWVKNGFVFAPLLFTGGFLEKSAVIHTIIAACLFCIASSATYIVNDLWDRESDRQHPKKSRTRPLAAGDIQPRQALILLMILYALLVAGYFIQPQVVFVITLYLALNVIYTFVLKYQPVLDIFCIAIGFVLRVYAGAQALTVPVSAWMFVTTLCLALYLAAIKRRQELVHNGAKSRQVLQYYSLALVNRYAEMSAIGALLFYSLFIITAKPHMVATIPLVIYGLFRYWFIVDKHEAGESPTDALLADWQLILTLLVWVGACVYSFIF